MAMNDDERPDLNGKSPSRVVGESVSEITEKVTLLVTEEVELVKAEISAKLSRLGAGAAVVVAAGIFILFGLFAAVNALGWGLAEIFNEAWIGFLVLAGGMFVLAVIAGLIAYGLFKNSSPVPEMAIEEARKTKEMIGSSD